LWAWQTYKDLLETLDKRFATIDLSHAAARDLDNIMQKKRPFQDFLAEFDLLALKCDKSDREKVALLRKKVSSEIAALTTSMVDPPKLDDYDEWCRILGIFANNIADAEHRQKSNQNQSQSNHQNQTQNNNSSGEPMDLDAIYAELDLTISRLDEAERTRRWEEGRCLYCGVAGHTKNKCRRAQAAVAARRGAGRGRGGNRGGRGGRGGGNYGSSSGNDNYNGYSYTQQQQQQTQYPYSQQSNSQQFGQFGQQQRQQQSYGSSGRGRGGSSRPGYGRGSYQGTNNQGMAYYDQNSPQMTLKAPNYQMSVATLPMGHVSEIGDDEAWEYDDRAAGEQSKDQPPC